LFVLFCLYKCVVVMLPILTRAVQKHQKLELNCKTELNYIVKNPTVLYS
jgi:hypothetical protein